MNTESDITFTCPFPIQEYPTLMQAHGGGGRLMHQLIDKMFLSAFDNPLLRQGHDAAVLKRHQERLAFTTDSYVISPLFFPGGNIGTLAVNGTVNDLAMVGARPLYLSCGFILEEGLPMEDLWLVVQAMRAACGQSGVQIVTGDTKVVGRGKGDGIFINTSGVGVIEHDLTINPAAVKPGDAVLINGDVGDHGMAVMAQREGLRFETTLKSDTAPLAGMVLDLISNGINPHCLRDLTRGGLASALNEISGACGNRIYIEENKVPVKEETAGACEMLGLDPLYVANEGRMAVFVPANQAQKTLAVMRRHPQGEGACVIGQVGEKGSPMVIMRGKIGTTRVVDMISGEQLPRIC